MSDRLFTSAGSLVAAMFLAAMFLMGGSTASGGDYRGTTAGWPTYANGSYAANYPANYGAGPAYYVARPVAGGAYAPAVGAMYMPVRAAYANPSYFAAYGRSPTVYRPVAGVGYAPAAGAYYAPTTANYAPANSYAVSPAGISSAGSEAAAYYGQPTNLNYVPPRYAYRTTYAQVPVYMYRPVTAYDPVTGQGVTCLQPATSTACQPQRSRCFSLLNPFSWFSRRSSCGAAPTTAYCGTACGQAGGQPYYPTQPVVPIVPYVPGPAMGVPANTIPALPRGFIPPAGTTIPPPPTRTIITSPADAAPSLAPRPGTFTPSPGTSFGAPPAGSVTPLPSNTFPAQPGFGTPATPGGSFQTVPAQPQPGFGPGSFGTGTNYAPTSDPYRAALTPAQSMNAAASGTTPNSNSESGPAHSVFGSGYRGGAEAGASRTETNDDGVIRAPGSKPALPPSVRTVPDLDVPKSPQPVNSAPQLLDPRDKTAGRDRRWAVVPALWPKKEAATGQLSERPVVPRNAHEPHSGSAVSPYISDRPDPANYDDGGWKTAAGF